MKLEIKALHPKKNSPPCAPSFFFFLKERVKLNLVIFKPTHFKKGNFFQLLFVLPQNIDELGEFGVTAYDKPHTIHYHYAARGQRSFWFALKM